MDGLSKLGVRFHFRGEFIAVGENKEKNLGPLECQKLELESDAVNARVQATTNLHVIGDME